MILGDILTVSGYHGRVQLQYEITPAEHFEMVKNVRVRTTERLVRICLFGVGILVGVVAYQYLGQVFGAFLISLFLCLSGHFAANHALHHSSQDLLSQPTFVRKAHGDI